MTTAISNVTAIDASKFVQSIGVNTHLGNWTVYENVGLVESSLAYLGVSSVRDGSMFSTAHAQAAYSQLASDGIKFDFLTPQGTDPATFLKQLDAFVAAHPGQLIGIEGPNEVDIQTFTYNGSSSLSSAAAFQRALFAGVQADSALKDVPVYNLTLSQSNSANYSQVGNLSSSADYANIHAYVWSGTTPNQVIQNDIKIAQWDAAGLPVIFTETGYDTMTSDTMSGVDQTVQAKYTLDTLMDAFKSGVAQTFLYELFDEAADPKFTDKEAHFGLFNNDGSPKLVATAIHNLTTILNDPSASQPFTPGTLGYSLDNLPTSAQQLLLEKHNGTFDLVLWDEHVIWDPTKQKEIASPTSDVTVNLGKSYAVVYVYDPLVGSSPIATYTNVSQIHVSLTDHPLVIQIGTGNASGDPGADITPPAAPSIASFSSDTGVAGDGITKANQQTLQGTAEAGSKVLVFDGATQIGTATVDSKGNWSFTTGILTDGAHSFTGQAVDAAGNVSVVSSSVKVTIDTTAPKAPALISDTLTAGNKVVVSGTAEAGSTIKLYEGSTLLGTAVTASNGAWSVTTSALTHGAHAFTATATDVAGNVSGPSAALDPIVGTLIDGIGNASLTQASNRLWISSGGTDVLLKSNGTAYLMGPTSTWKPIAVEATSSGFDVAWKNIITGAYTVWTTDSNGNFTSNLLSNVSGTSASLQSIETLFQQDLNGDGVIGSHSATSSGISGAAVNAGTADTSGTTSGTTAGLLESAGTTSLTQSGNYLHLSSGSTEVVLKSGGAAYAMGPTSTWTAIGAEATSSGYDVAWKNIYTGAYTVWATDSNGNFTSNLLSNVSGTGDALKAIETVMHQDLNGDGVINTASSVLDISGKVVLDLTNMSQAVKIEAGATLELTGGVSGSITFASETGTLVLDHATQFTGKIYGLTGDGSSAHSDILDLRDISFGTGTQVSYAGNTSGGVLTVSDAQNHVAKLTLVGDYTHSTFNLSSDGKGGTLVIDPPADGFNFAVASSQPVPVSLSNALASHFQPAAALPTDTHFDHNVQLASEIPHPAVHDGFLLHV
ncbi:Ig-like domain-containing protein [Bradyrhizobium commune]|uniref:Bacterial Ig-like domain-containing protein n=1 Tax=Bradyrhizobium commune TaxID=83627 RepID=A0A7S9D2Z7_9BRAD|nr:Ig-like domain-containing protein [Bradyrhizobium commune]QPF90257.1 hypothetical protein IC761_27715 [Bradyrhizobium commune]